MAPGRLGDAGGEDRLPECSLDVPLVDVMPHPEPAARLARPLLGREDVLPAPLECGPGVLSGQGVRQVDTAMPLGNILAVELSHRFEMRPQGRLKAPWEDRPTVFLSLAVPDGDLAEREIDILDPEPQAFHQAQAGSVEKRAEEFVHPPETVQDGPDLLPGQNDGNLVPAAGTQQVELN